MRTDTSDRIVEYIRKKSEATAKELGDFLEISPQAVFKQLKKLVEQEKLEKRGKPPVVFYSLKEKEKGEKRKITDIRGNTKMISPCIACAIRKGEIQAPGGLIAASKYFEAQQDFEIPIPGFVILVSKRHFQGVDEFTRREQKDFAKFLCALRSAIRKALGIKTVYLIQEEDTSSHFHVWLFPRYGWMDKKFGCKVQSLKPIMEYAAKNMKTATNLKKVDVAAKKLQKYFKK